MLIRLAVLSAIALAVSPITNCASEIYITSKTDNINRRYYFVARLERTIKLLNTIKQQNSKLFMMNKKIDFNTLIKFDDTPTFHHKRIQNSIEKMRRDKTLKPLYEVWDDFAAYKFLEDELFIDEFTKEIFVISRNLLMQMIPLETRSSVNQLITELSRRSWNPSPVSTLASIDRITETLEQLTDGKHVEAKSYPASSYRLTDLCKEVHTDEVSTRFYYVKRMLKALEKVKDLSQLKNSAFKFGLSPENPFIIFDNTIELTHDRIIRCIETMEDEGSLEPIFSLWDDYKQFKYIQDERFNREFFIAVYLLYKNVAVNNNFTGTPTRSTISDAVALYEKLNSLPVEEIIEAIDTLVEIIELAGLKKPITWRQWSREYWWVPPIFFGTVFWGYWARR